MTPAEIADIWDQAADYIETHGWCQRDYENDKGACCALGAMNRVMGVGTYDPDYMFKTAEPHTALERHLNDLVSSWNDDPGRTKDEVVTELRTLAKSLRES